MIWGCTSLSLQGEGGKGRIHLAGGSGVGVGVCAELSGADARNVSAGKSAQSCQEGQAQGQGGGREGQHFMLLVSSLAESLCDHTWTFSPFQGCLNTTQPRDFQYSR